MLVDDSENMQTYWPGIGKLFEAIERKRIAPAQIYRFSNYPRRFFYHWRGMGRSKMSVESVLKDSSPEHTMVVVVSDCDAAIGLNDQERAQGTIRFLKRWQNSVRPIVWLNPVPSDRWAGTTAEQVQEYLRGRMIAPEQFNGVFLHSLMGSRGWQE